MCHSDHLIRIPATIRICLPCERARFEKYGFELVECFSTCFDFVRVYFRQKCSKLILRCRSPPCIQAMACDVSNRFSQHKKNKHSRFCVWCFSTWDKRQKRRISKLKSAAQLGSRFILSLWKNWTWTCQVPFSHCSIQNPEHLYLSSVFYAFYSMVRHFIYRYWTILIMFSAWLAINRRVTIETKCAALESLDRPRNGTQRIKCPIQHAIICPSISSFALEERLAFLV